MLATLNVTKCCNGCHLVKPADDFYLVKGKLRSRCKECHHSWRVAYHAANRDAENRTNRVYSSAHRDALYKVARAWVRANAERIPGYRAKYRATENGSAVEAAYHAANVDSARAATRRWLARNPARRREIHARWRARRRLATVEPVDYEAIWTRDQATCHICGTTVLRADRHFDHVIPLSRGGAHSMANVKVAHGVCNMRKGAR